jgi:ribosomal protein S18 acetylase RimI-like enzyme
VDIVSLSPTVESLFWKFVNQDIFHYFFFAYDWIHHRDHTEILLVIEQKQIIGMMLVYRDRIVQLRGSDHAAKILLTELKLDKVELQSSKKQAPLVLERYDPTFTTDLMLMTVHRGEETPEVRDTIVRLDASDAEEIALILREGIPEIWGDVTREQIVEGMSDRTWIGIKIDDELASLCSYQVTEWTGLVGRVATHKKYRNRGFATSTISFAVKQMVQTHSDVMIFVRTDNSSAIHVYQKVGFKPYRTYFYMKGRKLILKE